MSDDKFTDTPSTIPGQISGSSFWGPEHPAPLVNVHTIEIRLSNGMVALVSPEDAELAAFTWTAHFQAGNWYAVRKKNGRVVRLHHEVWSRAHPGAPRPARLDHWDGNGLNNQRRNLRPATHAQNMQNSRCNRDGYKGVARSNGRWLAQIGVEGRRLYLGRFADPVAAAHAYDDAARQHFGEFAALNFPREGERGARSAA